MITNSDEINIFGDNKINVFGDKISWENHIDEIFNDIPKENIYYNKDMSKEKINRIKKYKQRGKVLDCGCFIGRWIETFRDNGFEYTGIDQCNNAIKIAKENKPDGKFINKLLWNMTFQEDFDIAHFNAVLQHNKLEEQEKIIPKVYQALKSNGILVMSESTVPKQTFTQRTHEGWIEFIEKHGFKFMESWNKNEDNLEDNYLFVKLKKPSATAEHLKKLLKISDKKDEMQVSVQTFSDDYIPTYNSSKENKEKNVIRINEYWNSESEEIIPFIECINVWKNIKAGEECYFIYTNILDVTKIHSIKNIFNKAGFEYIENNESENKIVFKKLSISKIRNWNYLRHIHELLNNK